MFKLGYSELESEFINKTDKITYMVRGTSILFPFKEAMLFIDYCKEHQLKVLGIDGFFIKGDTIQPNQDHSSEDFDDLDFEKAFFEAVNFLKARETEGLWYEVVL